MAERTIKVLRHSYREKSSSGKMVTRVAKRGETIDVEGDELERGERLGAFVTDEDVEAVEAADTKPDNLDEMGSDELSEVVGNFTVKELVEQAHESDDPEFVQRLIAAENANTGNDPRKSLIAGLEEVASRRSGGE